MMKEMKAVSRSMKNPRKWLESITSRIEHGTLRMIAKVSEYRLGIENKRLQVSAYKSHHSNYQKSARTAFIEDHSP